MRTQYDGLGPVSEISFLGGTWTVLLGPDACGAALRNADKAFASGPGWGRLVGPFFDRGLMLLDFEEHHRHRRLMQEAFTRVRLAGYTAALGPAVAAGLDAWQPRPGFRVYPALKELTLDLATQVFMGGRGADHPGRAGRGQRGVHRLRPARDRHRPASDPGHAVGSRTERATAARGLLRPAPGEQAGPAGHAVG